MYRFLGAGALGRAWARPWAGALGRGLGPWAGCWPWAEALGRAWAGALGRGLGPWGRGLGPWALGLGPWALGLGPWALGLGPWAGAWALGLGPGPWAARRGLGPRRVCFCPGKARRPSIEHAGRPLLSLYLRASLRPRHSLPRPLPRTRKAGLLAADRTSSAKKHPCAPSSNAPAVSTALPKQRPNSGRGSRVPCWAGALRRQTACLFSARSFAPQPSRLVMNECGGTDLVSQVLPPMTLPLPTVTSPPRMVAPA